jgi:hypothetical protein
VPKIRRKTFAAREDLIKLASDVAKKKGFTFYAFMNDILQLTLEAEEMGVSLRNLIEERGLLKAAKDASFVLGLESLWYDMADIASGVEDQFQAFKSDLKAFTWNVSEIDIEEMKDEVSIRIISPKFSESYTNLFASFLESALVAFGFSKVEKEITRGTIRMKGYRERN